MPSRHPRPGFTLIEVLVATGLVSLVLALALKGFTEAKKIADMTKNKVVAQEEAALGAQKIAKLLRRAHIIYFDAHPIGDMSATPPVTLAGVNALLRPIPPSLVSEANTGDVLMAPTNGFQHTSIAGFSLPPVARSGWRVLDFADATTQGRWLRTAEAATTTLTPFEEYFTSPLLYMAEATFNTSAPDTTGLHVDPNLPMTWTFSLVYLAPMRFTAADANHGLFPTRGNSVEARRDRGAPRTGGAAWARSTVPYELRLLTIPDVPALLGGKTAVAPSTAIPPVGRQLRRRLDMVGVLPFPYDVKANDVNYDPIAQPAEAATFTKLNQASAHYGAASGGRVAKTSGTVYSHGNWNNLGNDPPTDQVFLATRERFTGTDFDTATAGTATDISLAKYVDPDAVSGTFVRLANDLNLLNPGEAAGAARPYINAYGGPQRYSPRIWNANNADITVPPPKRALVSVSTRYRTSKQLPFVFATEQVEVDLEALVKFQNATYRTRR
jgi:prepilin-type N-terminal cleavage/methylation domain-containing protein